MSTGTVNSDYGINISDYTDGGSFGGSKVLLHEAETCLECKKKFLSLYPLKSCLSHEGIEEI